MEAHDQMERDMQKSDIKGVPSQATVKGEKRARQFIELRWTLQDEGPCTSLAAAARAGNGVG